MSFPSALSISPKLLVQPLCRDAVNVRKIDIQHDLLITNCENSNVRRFVLRCHTNLSFSSMLAPRRIRQGLPPLRTKSVRTEITAPMITRSAAPGSGRNLRPLQVNSVGWMSKVAVCDLKHHSKSIRPAAEWNTPAACAPQNLIRLHPRYPR
jgi:hypothetical protein